MQSCPDNIKVKTAQSSQAVKWEEPVFTDNCGEYPDCNVQITTTVASNSIFYVNVPITVKYTARDPSDNRNEECKFDVKLEGMLLDSLMNIIFKNILP